MLKRFTNKVKILPNGCHQWTGAKDRDGYGKFQLDGKCIFAHRYAFLCHCGKLYDELVIDHLCRNRDCVNPEHLEQVTVKENTNRGENFQANKTHCINGHEFTHENIYLDPSGGRQCRECRRLLDRKRRPSKGPKTHCKRGHEFSQENTLVSGGRRICRVCKRDYDRIYQRGRRAQAK